MIIRNLALNEAHFILCFIGSLKEKSQFAVKMFKTRTLKVAIEKLGCKSWPLKLHRRVIR